MTNVCNVPFCTQDPQTPANAHHKTPKIIILHIYSSMVAFCLLASPSLIADMAAMADHLLAAQDARPLGKLWANSFVRRCTELKTCPDFQKKPCVKFLTR